MASGSATRTYHSTLAASTVDTVTLGVLTRNVTVVNRSSTATQDIYVTAGDDIVNPANPTVGGAETYVVPVGQTAVIPVATQGPSRDQGTQPAHTVVKLISSGAAPYSVIG